MHARIRAMLRAGTIRRVRQTLMATNLAPGALVAWQVPAEKLDAAFDYFVHDDPFSGHVVIRSTDARDAGIELPLWTTLKVPQGYSMHEALRGAGASVWARTLPRDAGEALVRARRRARAAEGDGARDRARRSRGA